MLHIDAISVDDVEAQANAFAAEFLMPVEVIRSSLRNLKIGRLLDLKREYGVSMQALVERAYQLDLLSPSQRTGMYKMFSAKGWRTREPGSEDIALERPELARSIFRDLNTRGLSPQEVANIAGFSDPSHNTLFRSAGLGPSDQYGLSPRAPANAARRVHRPRSWVSTAGGGAW